MWSPDAMTSSSSPAQSYTKLSLKLRSAYFNNRAPCSTDNLPTKLLLTHTLFNHPFHRHNHLHFHRASLHYPNHQHPTPTTNIHQSRRLIPPRWCRTLRTTSRRSSSTLCASFKWNNDLYMVSLQLPIHHIKHLPVTPTVPPQPSPNSFCTSIPRRQSNTPASTRHHRPSPTCHQRLRYLFLYQ